MTEDFSERLHYCSSQRGSEEFSLEKENLLLRAELAKLRASSTSTSQDNQRVIDVLDSMGDGFIELDKNYIVLRVNKTQERISGLSRDQTLGRNHWDIWPKNSIPKIWEAYRKVIQENIPARVEDFNTALRIWLEVDAYPTPTGGIAAFFRDITAHKNAFSTLQAERHRFNRLAAASGIGVFYSDLPFSDLIWDDKMKEHFWLPPNVKVTIDKFYERIHPQDRAMTRKSIESAIESHIRYDIEYRTTHPKDNGEFKWIRSIGWTDYDPSGKPVRFDGITLDVTPRKISEQALRESESRQKLLSDKMLQGVIHHRRDGSIISMNPSAQRILGMSSKDLFNPLLGAPGHPNIRDDGSMLPLCEHPVMIAIETGKLVSAVVLGIYNPKEESYRWIEKDAVPLYHPKENEPYEIFAIFSDITERKRIEKELRHTSDHLKTSVADLELERDLRERFVATLSHDLRTPITSAKLCSQLILRKAECQKLVENLAGRSIFALDRANDMIQDLLDANLIRAGQKLPLELSEFNLTKLVSDTLDELRTIHGDRFKLEIEEEVTGCWNQSGIRRVLENLVNNAVKYGSHARPIRISLLKKSHHIQLRVHNEGPPIPEGEQSKLFHPFQRTVSAQAGPKKGWGLGLTLVKGIAEAHGGRVELKSDYNSGTTFSVLLPIDARSNSCAHSSLI